MIENIVKERGSRRNEEEIRRHTRTSTFHKAVLLHVFDGLLELFALISLQAVSDQPAEFGKTIFIDGSEIETRLALHALPERRRQRFHRRGIVIHMQQVEAHVILVGPYAGKVKRLAAMENGRTFQVIVSRLVGLDVEIPAKTLKKLA